MSDIAEWLAARGLGQLTHLFENNDIDCDVLRHLTEADLRDLGLSVGLRKRLLSAISSDGSNGMPAGATDVQASPAAAAPLSRAAEWRQLTVMFCDLADSTELSTRLDPEDLRDVLQSYQSCCASSIGRCGGSISNYMGDGILACFGYPQAHEDNAERAVYAALAIIKDIEQLRPLPDVALHVRIGIATGMVVVGDLASEGVAEKEAIVGETPNLAARLQSIAELDSIVISATTRRLIGELFEVGALGKFDLKGFADPVPVWRVLGEGAAESRFDALHAPGMGSIVGRQHELDLLLDRWEKVCGGAGQVVLISGEPGIGKSRLTTELRESLIRDNHFRLGYYGSQHHQTSALYPIIAQIKRDAAIARDDTNEQRLEKLESLLRLSKRPTSETVPLIAALLDIRTGDRYPALDLTPRQLKDATLDTFLTRLKELAAQKPVLLLVEDTQWIDPTTLDLVGTAIDHIASLPVLVLITFRPEFVPPWGGRTPITHLSLNRLNRQQAAAVVTQSARGERIPAEILDQIIAKADGMPLFLEELTKAVLDAGATERDEGHRLTAPALTPLAIPNTLHDSLMARLDRMSMVKQVAQLAATIGRTFSLDLLRAISPVPAGVLDHALTQLVEAGIIYREDRPPDVTFEFKHALLQDVAHQSLLRSTRRQYHSHIGRTLAEKFPDISEVQPEFVAYHFTEGGEAAEAIEYWRRAAKRATQRSANAEAIAQFRSALDLLENIHRVEDRKRHEYELLMGLIPPLVAAKGYSAAEVEQTSTRALELAEELGDTSQIFPVLYGRYGYHLMSGQIRKAATLAREFSLICERQRANDLTPIAGRLVPCCRFLLGDPDYGRDTLEAAVASYDVRKHRASAFIFGHDHLATGLGYLCLMLWHRGLVEQAHERYQQSLAHGRTLSHPNSESVVHFYGAVFHALSRDAGSARACSGELLRLGKAYKLPLWSSCGLFFSGQAIAEDGNCAEGIALMQEGLAALKSIHVAHFRPSFLSWLAAAWGRVGKPENGLAVLDEAFLVVKSGGECWMESDLYRVKGELLRSRGGTRNGEAEDCFAEAIAIARRQGSRSFELRAATALGRLWRLQGKSRQARALIQEASAPFAAGLDTPDLADARSLLADGA
jgi:class 3 adenylate cyclase/predicted ATPase/nucleoside-triphosphatase THEP1